MNRFVGKVCAAVVVMVSALYMIQGCSGNSQIAGGGIDVGNPGITARISGTVVYEESGAYAAGTHIYLRPADFVRDVSDSSLTDTPDAVTDSSGTFVLDSVDTGNYAIELDDDAGQGAFLEMSVNETGQEKNIEEVNLRSKSGINGAVSFAVTPEQDLYACIAGLGRTVKVDTATGVYTFEDIPAGTYDIKLISASEIYSTVEVSDVSVAPETSTVIDTVVVYSAEDEDYSLWNSTALVKINTTAEGAGVFQDIHGFPVLLRLDRNNFDFTGAQTDGGDIRFAKNDGSPVPYEIERWDAAGKKAEIWVLMDTVYGDNNAQNFKMYWGNEDAWNRSRGSNVFDTANAFAAVWHMNSSEDATFNGNDAEDVNTSIQEGVTGYAKEFNGTDSYMACGNDGSILNISSAITVSCWLKTTMPPSSLVSILRHDEHFTALQLTGDSSTAWTGLWFESEALLVYFPWEGVFNDGQWHNFAVSYDAATGPEIYIDGTLRFSNNEITGELVNISTADFMIGATESNTENYDGQLDEVRVEAESRGAGWIKLSHENQKPGSSVVTLVK